MNEETRLNMVTARDGLGYSLEMIEEGLLGAKRGYVAQQAQDGPFARALSAVGEIADGAPVTNLQQTREDLLFLFEMLRFLRGGFWASAWAICKPVHEQVADRISAREAAAILGAPESRLAVEERLGRLHPIDLLGDVWAGYEVEALKAKVDAAKRPFTAEPVKHNSTRIEN